MTPEFQPHAVAWDDERVSRFWDYLARRDAGEFFSEKHSHWIADAILRSKPRTVVDIGCGTGPLVAELSLRGVEAVGVDSSPEVLQAARERAPGATFHLGSGTAIPLPAESVDAASLIEVVEHLDDATLAATLAEARRVLKRGARLIITTPNREDLAAASRQCPDCGAEFHVYQHVRSWTSESLAATLRAASLAPLSIKATRPLENGPALELLARRLWQRVKPQEPRLLVIAEPA